MGYTKIGDRVLKDPAYPPACKLISGRLQRHSAAFKENNPMTGTISSWLGMVRKTAEGWLALMVERGLVKRHARDGSRNYVYEIKGLAEKEGYIMLHDEVLKARVPASIKLMYGALDRLERIKEKVGDGRVITVREAAGMVGMGKKTAMRAVRRLVELGWVEFSGGYGYVDSLSYELRGPGGKEQKDDEFNTILF